MQFKTIFILTYIFQRLNAQWGFDEGKDSIVPPEQLSFCSVPSRDHGTITNLRGSAFLEGQQVQASTIISLECDQSFIFIGPAQSRCNKGVDTGDVEWQPELGSCWPNAAAYFSQLLVGPDEAVKLHAAVQAKSLTQVQDILESIQRPLDRQYLIEHENEVSYGRTALVEAATYGSLPIVQYLIGQGANVLAKDTAQGNTAAHLAAYFGFFDILKFLVDGNPILLQLKNDRNNAVFNLAAMGGQLPIVRYLAEDKNVAIDQPGDYGRTPLLTASETGRLPVVQYLIGRGVNLTAIDTEHRSTALHLAAEYGFVNVCQALTAANPNLLEMRNKFNDTPVFRAALGGYLDVVQYLVDNRSADFEARGFEGRTPFIVSAEKGFLNLVKYLAGKGANVTATETGVSGSNALHLAAWNQHLEVVTYLLEIAPSLLNSRNNYGQTPLALARAASPSNPVIAFLLAKGAQ